MPAEVEISEVAEGLTGIRQDDIIIAFMGPIGVGKSFFIDLLTDQKGKRENQKLKSSMAKVQVTCLKHKKYPARRVVLVDTPGFDDTTKTDLEVLDIINKWLTDNYQNHVRLSGIMYLHRITDNRVGGSVCRMLRTFGKLVGDDAMKNVVLVSTMWEKVDPKVGEDREKELVDIFWSTMIEKGSKTVRLEHSTFTDAWRLVHELIEEASAAEKLQLQKEIEDLKTDLRETEAGKSLYTSFQKLLADQRAFLKTLIEHAKQPGNEESKKKLEGEARRIEKAFWETFDTAKKAKVSIGWRILLFFLGTRAKVAKVGER
ncbi:hypothetical protein AN958_02490 [Leucoagaricus sp. SymC.cos]|nr:hypothetical protein AN958_02490 [Leucoagaricus sp. SymC.cos]